jgi:hypothetical protein
MQPCMYAIACKCNPWNYWKSWKDKLKLPAKLNKHINKSWKNIKKCNKGNWNKQTKNDTNLNKKWAQNMLWAWTYSHPWENEPTVHLFMREWACFVIVSVSSLRRLNVDHSGIVDPGWPLVMTAVMTAGGVVLSPWKGRCFWVACQNDTPVLSCWLV